jgi:anti-anti-sigma factor
MFTTISPAVPPAQPDIDTRHIVRVSVAGEVDLSSSDVLRVRLFNVLSALRPRHLEIDLAGVPFMDCSGLTVLVVLGQAAARTGCQLRITNPQPIVRRVLDLTGLLDVLTTGLDRPPLPVTTAHGIAPTGVQIDLTPPVRAGVGAVATLAGCQFRLERTPSPAGLVAGSPAGSVPQLS